MMSSVAGSADAPTFEEYVGTAWPALYRYAYLLTGNHGDAVDLAQQTLLKAYRSWARVQGADGQPWFRLLSGLYIVDDPTVTSYGEV